MSLSQALNQFAQNLGRYPRPSKYQANRNGQDPQESSANGVMSQQVSPPSQSKYLKHRCHSDDARHPALASILNLR